MRRLLLALWTLLLFVVCFSSCSSPEKDLSNQICFSDGCIQIEIAQTHEERMRGLQDRKNLSKNKGMLFIFQESKKHSFWMKDTIIALDIVWIDSSKRIVTIIPNVYPCETEKTEKCPVYTPSKKALYVLEVNAGVTLELELKVGDHAIFQSDSSA